MKKLLAFLGLLALPTFSMAAGNSNPLTVSSGTFKSIDLYDNASGGARQAIVVGDVSSSFTAHVDPIQGMQVFLGTSTASSVGTFTLGNSISTTSIVGSVIMGNTISTTSIVGSVIIGNFVTTTTVVQANALNVVSTNTVVTISTAITNGVVGSTIAVVNAQGTTLAISGSINATSVDYTTSPVNGFVPLVTGMTGFVNPSGLSQDGKVDVSSDIYVYVANLSTITIIQPNSLNVVSTSVIISANIPNVSSTNTYVTNYTSSPIFIQNQAGALAAVGWQVGGASIPVATVTFGSITYYNLMNTSGTVVVSSNVIGYSDVGFTLYPGTGPVVAPLQTVVFEVSTDSGSNWFPVTCYQQGSEVAASSYTLVGTTTSWVTNLYSATNFRIRLGNFQSGFPAATIVPMQTSDDRFITANLTVQAMSNGIATPTSVGYQSGASSVPVNVLNTVPVIIGNFITTTTVVQANALNVVSTFTLVGQLNALNVVSTNTVSTIQVVASSATTFPASIADKSTTTVLGDTYGRVIIQEGAPTSLYLSTTTGVIAHTSYSVLVASPAATIFSHMCGCIIANTAATAATVDIVATGNKNNGTTRDYRTVFVPASDTRGIWSGCGSPFLNSIAGGVQISALSSSASANLTISCQYYQNTTP